MNCRPGTWQWLVIVFAALFVAASFGLWFFYRHYDVFRDPKTSALVGTVGAILAQIAKWLRGDVDHDAEYWRERYEEQRSNREAIELEYRQYRLENPRTV